MVKLIALFFGIVGFLCFSADSAVIRTNERSTEASEIIVSESVEKRISNLHTDTTHLWNGVSQEKINKYGGVVAFLWLALCTGTVIAFRIRRRNQTYEDLAKEFMLGVDNKDATSSNFGALFQTDFEAGNALEYAVALRMPYDKNVELARSDFEIDKTALIGVGQSGTVVKGHIKGRAEPVAFKCTAAHCSITNLKGIMSEIKILSYLGEHENLVCILGAHTKKINRGIVYIALDYCPMGSLDTFLKKINKRRRSSSVASTVYAEIMNDHETLEMVMTSSGYTSNCSSIPSSVADANDIPNTPPSLPDRAHSTRRFLRWSYQLASAMEYVAAKNVVHADIAARNVLLKNLNQVKLGDFGLSKRFYLESSSVKHEKNTPLPWRWMSPESVRHLMFSSESDVWSFGVTLWEIFSLAELPYSGVNFDENFASKLENGLKLPPPAFANLDICNILWKCWEVNPCHRPTFSQLKDELNALLDGDHRVSESGV